MAGKEEGEVWTTISFDKLGNILEVRNRHGKVAEPRHYGDKRKHPEVGDVCPEGQVEIKAVKTIEVVYVTCADTSDPCWVYDPATRRWRWDC
jgi:hypothetical protein